MNVNSLIASLLAPAHGTATASAGAPSTASATADSGAQFKAQFGQAVAALTTIVSNVKGASGASSSASATNAATTAGTTDALQAALQKKIGDLLAAGNSVAEIVQQLAAALANTFAGQLSGGTLAQLQAQLQSTFASALAPTGSGPPASTAELASTLAQRYRQIAGLAAGVIGEAGQSNRLFAGSFSDAATTAGGQPAPGSTNGNSAADSTASDASALLASLTASQGDGKTVASTAPAIGTNGDTLLGRILTRAAQAQASSTVASTSSESATPSTLATAPAATTAAASSVDRAIAAAMAALTPSFPSTTGAAANAAANATTASAITAVPVDVLASLASKSLAATTATIDAAKAPVSAATTAATTPAAATAAATTTPLAPTASAFVKAFSDALGAAGTGTSVAGAGDKAQDGDDDGTATVLPTTVASTQAPTVGAFAPVAPAQTVDALAANPTPPSQPQPAATTDPNTVVEQVLRGAFLTTTGALSTVRLKLVPDSLGDVSVKLNISGSSVAAQVVAQTPAAHDALVAGQAQLTRSLADAGLKLTSFSVSLGGGGFMGFQQQQQQSAQQQTPTGRPLLLGDVDSSETDDSSLAAIPSFAPPATAAPSGWGAYNYLV